MERFGENEMLRASLICLFCVMMALCIGCDSGGNAKRGTETIIPTVAGHGQGQQCVPFFAAYPENWEQALAKNE
jgi:hypothetical protein